MKEKGFMTFPEMCDTVYKMIVDLEHIKEAMEQVPAEELKMSKCARDHTAVMLQSQIPEMHRLYAAFGEIVDGYNVTRNICPSCRNRSKCRDYMKAAQCKLSNPYEDRY